MSRRGGTLESFDLDKYLGRCYWPTKYPAGRSCSREGCDTVLSVYNATDWCGLHTPEPDWNYCGYAFRICPACEHLSQVKGSKPARTCGKCGFDFEEVTPMNGGSGESGAE